MRGTRRSLWAAVAMAIVATPAGAQERRDSATTGAVVVEVLHDARPLEAATVRAGRIGAQTNALGRAALRLLAGSHVVVATRLGYRPDSTIVVVRAGTDTAVSIALASQPAEIEAIVVSATRSERRVEDVPLRVEVIDEEEIAEKVAMTPGDIAMMLNETSGLRVQTTSPSLGGASVRIQGLVGHAIVLKYTPTLRFVLDESLGRGNQVLRILDELEKSMPAEQPANQPIDDSDKPE